MPNCIVGFDVLHRCIFYDKARIKTLSVAPDIFVRKTFESIFIPNATIQNPQSDVSSIIFNRFVYQEAPSLRTGPPDKTIFHFQLSLCYLH